MPIDRDTTSPSGLLAPGFRIRRAHGKSRSGCLRCKTQRKKCDELRPICSRCAKRAYCCRYPSTYSDPGALEEGEDVSATDMTASPDDPAGSLPDLDMLPVPSDGYVSTPGPLSSAIPPAPSSPRLSDVHDPQVQGQIPSSPHSASPGYLDATDLDLLSHYLTHTSKCIPFDEVDLYALSVGVPNLAFTNRPVMSSLLALAAACKTHDVFKTTGGCRLDSPTLAEAQELLARADNHHRVSLQHIQAEMSDLKSYDAVLINSALTVLYACASHAVRVQFAGLSKGVGHHQVPAGMLPHHSQWISFIRLAHTASTAVLQHLLDGRQTEQENSQTIPLAAAASPGPFLGNFSSGTGWTSQGSMSKRTRGLFYPLVASTYGRALTKLRGEVESASFMINTDSSRCQSELKACLEALEILERRATLVISQSEDIENTDPPLEEPLPFNQHSKVSPWVGKYMISVTSMKSPKALRRVVMSFLNHVPSKYLDLIETVTELQCAATTDKASSLNEIQLLAANIFAHWLVFVTLLDGVWWIGDIGHWELGRIVSLFNTQSWLSRSADSGETWWPKNMYVIKQELTENS